MKDFDYVYGGFWLASIIAGAICYELVPEAFQYITAFAAGSFSFMFLQLARGK